MKSTKVQNPRRSLCVAHMQILYACVWGSIIYSEYANNNRRISGVSRIFIRGCSLTANAQAHAQGNDYASKVIGYCSSREYVSHTKPL